MDPAAGNVQIMGIKKKDRLAMMFFQKAYRPWLRTAMSWRIGVRKTAALANEHMYGCFDSAAGSWKDLDVPGFVERSRSSASFSAGRTESR